MPLSRRQPRLSPLLPATWLWLAMAAALLMAIAPVVSYTLQALGPAQVLATGHRLAASHASHGEHPSPVDAGHPHPAQPAVQAHSADAAHGTHHHQAADPHGAPAAVQDSPTGATTATNPHADHGAACDYCLIAARAVAVIAALLWLLLAPHNAGLRPTGPATRTPARQPWPAHAARGPPLIA